MKQLVKCAIFSLLVFNYMPVSASVIIDNFNDATTQFVVDTGGGATSTVATANALGGFRTIDINDGGNFSTATVMNGMYSHNGAAGAAATSTVTWDAAGAGLGGIDLLATDTLGFMNSTCFECFVLEIISIDQGDVNLTLDLEDIAAGTASVTSLNAGLGIFEILFSNFNSVNLALINSISLTVHGSAASDLQLNLLGYTGAAQIIPPPTSAVPVAPTLWLLLLGLIGFSTFRKSDGSVAINPQEMVKI